MLVVLLLAAGVIAVLCVTYPELQQNIKEFLENFFHGIGNFFKEIFKPVESAFNGG
ncbi:MAG: hypothetical protein FWC27_00285 [Firmicutes bacterium]|nr:hypothetical protein [Bacillota bacterium]